MQLLRKFNKVIRLLFCVIDIYSKYAGVIPLKDKKALQLLMLFKNFWMSQVANQAKFR